MKIKTFKCPDCGANLEIEEGYKICYCKYCGAQAFIDEEKHEQTININRTERHINDAKIIEAKARKLAIEEKAKEEKRAWIALAIMGLLGLLIIAGVNLSFVLEEKIAESKGEISAGFYQDLIGQDYETVVAHFESAGFENIELIDLDDSRLAVWKDGKVEQVSIAGDNTFNDTDYFPPESKVVISYH